jgi:hypothetical protein
VKQLGLEKKEAKAKKKLRKRVMENQIIITKTHTKDITKCDQISSMNLLVFDETRNQWGYSCKLCPFTNLLIIFLTF